jgi:acyl transferase domain-containing protein
MNDPPPAPCWFCACRRLRERVTRTRETMASASLTPLCPVARVTTATRQPSTRAAAHTPTMRMAACASLRRATLPTKLRALSVARAAPRRTRVVVRAGADDAFDGYKATTAFLFPGQGAQAVGMAAATCAELPAAKALFDKASEILGYDLLALCTDGPAEKLNSTAGAPYPSQIPRSLQSSRWW